VNVRSVLVAAVEVGEYLSVLIVDDFYPTHYYYCCCRCYHYYYYFSLRTDALSSPMDVQRPVLVCVEMG
jgi:hypothetical protein